MISTTCPHCGKPTFGRTDRTLLTRLQEAQEPISGDSLFAGINVRQQGQQVVLNRLRKKLKRQGYRIANVAPHPSRARYRLQKIEDA